MGGSHSHSQHSYYPGHQHHQHVVGPVPPGYPPPSYNPYPYQYSYPPPYTYPQQPGWPPPPGGYGNSGMTNGQMFLGEGSNSHAVQPPYHHYPGAYPHAPYPLPASAAVTETQRTVTIKNDINVKSKTLRLEKDPENPSEYLLSFTFDATVDGSISILFVAQEREDCSFVPMHQDIFQPQRFKFRRGLAQTYRQASGSGICLSKFLPEELEQVGPGEVYPLVIRTEANAGSATLAGEEEAAEGSSADRAAGSEQIVEGGSGEKSEEGEREEARHGNKEGMEERSEGTERIIGDRLPRSVQSQMTYAVLKRKERKGREASSSESREEGVRGEVEYEVLPLKQKIWVEGMKYELQEIYGIENSGPIPADESEVDSENSAKECVICLSAPRDTTVLPCRHMCMCGECAKVLRYQSNRCPICRQVVERLLEIRVPATNESAY